MVRSCLHCGCSDIDEDPARGDATCTGCGTVLEESIVVSENQFQERAGGSGHTLVGQFVSMERAHTHSVQGVAGVSQESRELTHQKGRKLIEEIASQLRINQHCIDTAFNFFKMCVNRFLTRGRIRSHVVAACLYMTCRLENTAHLLLDFSDVTQVNVFDLGRTLSFLSRSLRINLPSTDPCLYIMRFACLLEFGEKQKEVVNLATRLVQRMKRDWMSTGRRPTGLCGAALLIAARTFNFNRSIQDVVRVVHISESVVRKRLEEFSQTPSGGLTIDEFATVDLEHDEDPPAFREARRKAIEEQVQRETAQAAVIEKDLGPMEESLELALEKKRREKFKNTPYAKLIAGNIDDAEVGKAEAALVRNEMIDSFYDMATSDDMAESSSSTPTVEYGPTLHSLGISKAGHVDVNPAPPQFVVPALPQKDNPDGDLDLSGIDDDEIDSYILTETESSLKERFWMKNNGEHVLEMERRKKEREEQEDKDKDNPTKKKRRPSAPRNGQQASTAVEAMEKIIHEKRLSNKVNYDILKGIVDVEVAPSSATAKEPHPSASEVIENVNKLVVAKMEAGAETSPSSGPSMEFARGRTDWNSSLSKREKDVARKNARGPIAQMNVLKSVFEIESTSEGASATSTSADVEVEDKKPVLTRSRYPRARPIVKTAVSTTEEDKKKNSVDVKIEKKEPIIAASDSSTSSSHSQAETVKNETVSPEKTIAAEEKTESEPMDPGLLVRGKRKARPNIGGTSSKKAPVPPEKNKDCSEASKSEETQVNNGCASSSSSIADETKEIAVSMSKKIHR